MQLEWTVLGLQALELRDCGLGGDVAEMVGVTERAAQRIVKDLAEAGYVKRERVGRRNRYVVNPHAPMRHPAQSEVEVGELLRLLRPRP